MKSTKSITRWILSAVRQHWQKMLTQKTDKTETSDGEGKPDAIDEKDDGTNRNVVKKNHTPHDFAGTGASKTQRASKHKQNSDDNAEEKDTTVSRVVSQLGEFMAGHYSLRYNLLTEQTEFAPLGSGQYLVVDGRVMNSISLEAMREGISCWDRDVRRYVESNSVEAYHPFTLYFSTLPAWDGLDRVTPLAHRVSDDRVWTVAFHRWLLGMTAQWTGRYTDGQANSTAPLLVSTRQGWGKSTFCRMLMPDTLRRYFTESFSLTAQTAAELKLAEFGLINIDEFDRLPPSRMPLLKNLMQMQRLNVRRAYRSNTEPLRRIASFIGTSNRRDLLTDRTGSRRFICVELRHPIDNRPPEHKQLYAQLQHELDQSVRFWLSKREEREVQEHNKAFSCTSPAEEVFFSCFRFATNDEIRSRTSATGGAQNVQLLTSAEIFAELHRCNPAAMRGVTSRQFCKLIPALGRKVHTRNCNGYYVVRLK